MKCMSCGGEARDGQRFCQSCGAALEKKCQRCGATAPLQARFCGMCGGGFAAKPQATAQVPPSGDSSTPEPISDYTAERRQLTVMFADVVGATALSGSLDPEALRNLLRSFQQVCADCVKRYGGHIHQYAGDGVLAYFGYPLAHDNDAERAVLSGLEIVAEVRRRSSAAQQRQETALSVRIGIHTGIVVVGEMGTSDTREVHAIGETPNVASRIQGEASPDSVCISAATMHLLNQRFQTRSIGIRSLKGVAKQIELFAVDAALESQDAHAAHAARHSTPLIGRERELAHLEERWALARSGQGQAVLISGEGGIGKSRLLAAFRERAGSDEWNWRSIHCSPFYQNSALHPMIDLILRSLGRDTGALPADRSGALRRALEVAGLADEMTFALIASLVGLGADLEETLDGLAPDQRKRRTVDALIAWLYADAQVKPMVMMVEDLHWVDASTRELLGTLLERIADMPILIVLTFRAEFAPAWALHGHISTLPLARLTSEQSAQVALGVIAGNGLPAGILDAVVQRADGVPLFVEELTKAIVEAHSAADNVRVTSPNTFGREPALEVPATLRDSLTARLDRLGETKAIAQLASVLGREFDYPILHAICNLPQAELEERLARLNRAEIIVQRGIPPRSHYVFKHALIQESAYDTLLKSNRAQYHRRAADAYVQLFPDVAHAHPELVAHHFSRAGMPEQSIAHWQRAGEIAVSRSGYDEAIAHLSAALQQLALLPESSERITTELALRVKIGPALMVATGPGRQESLDNYDRASRIAEALGDSSEGFMALWGDWHAKNAASRILDAARRSDDLVALSRRLDRDDLVLQAHHSRWTNFYVIGDATVSRADTLEGIRLYDRERHRHHRHVYGGHDPGVCACGVAASVAWLTGHSEEAMTLADRAIAIGEQLDHPRSLCIAYLYATLTSFGMRAFTMARARAGMYLQLAEDYGFAASRGMAMVAVGACRVHAGETAFGLKLIEEGLGMQRRFGPGGWLGIALAMAATAHVQSSNIGRALELLTEAILHSEKSGAWIMRPDIDRLQTELLLQTKQIDSAQAIARLQAAIALAKKQGALALEWRVVMSLATLHAHGGRPEVARALLRTGYAGFSEGFTTPDLVEGKRLLDSLS